MAQALCTPGASILDLLEEDTLGCCVVVDGKVTAVQPPNGNATTGYTAAATR